MTALPKSATERRAAADARRRAAGDVRVSLWLSRKRAAELDGLVEAWRVRGGRAEMIQVAVAYLAQQTRQGLRNFKVGAA